MFTESPDRQSLLLFNRNPIQLNTRSACVLVAGTQKYFLARVAKVGKTAFLLFHHSRGSLSFSREGSFLNLPGENETIEEEKIS